MTVMHPAQLVRLALLSTLLLVSACGGGGGSTPQPQPPDPPIQTDTSQAFLTRTSTARFLTQATFGPTPSDIDTLTGTSPSQWLLQEFAKPVTLSMPIVEEYQALLQPGTNNYINSTTPSFAFWRKAITADDQLRQRVAFALSEIIVTSPVGSDLLTTYPEGIAHHQDILAQNAFGNYRDLLEDITYSAAMGDYLTYAGNQKADPVTGRMPDENYAREILQLFSIGVVELAIDGTPITDANGAPVETYDNTDITELAKVFTGLNYDDRAFIPPEDFSGILLTPMVIVPENHSPEPKTFLSTTIPANTPADQSIDLALDEIMAHPNVGPFIGRQLIQRLVTSDPEPDYVTRVATAFNTGRYTLPNGTSVGDGRKGDLKATIAAILFDPDARENAPVNAAQFGKIREPILRFTEWARAFEVSEVRPELVYQLYDASSPALLAQHPYRSPSVFNFFRPGYVAPGTETGNAGMTVPELQLVNASSVPGYANFMSYFALGFQNQIDVVELQRLFDEDRVNIDATPAPLAFSPDYTTALSLASDTEAFLDYLDELLTFGTMTDKTRQTVRDMFDYIPPTTPEFEKLRVGLAVVIVTTSPDFLVQR